MSKETLFTIYGLDIKSDTVYQVIPKEDPSAPKAFQDHGTTKILSRHVDNAVPGAIFDHEKNAWDTGMYLESRALNKVFPNETERKAALKNIEKYILAPIEKIKGKGALSHLATNNDFWDNFKIRVAKNEVFYSDKPMELLSLFLAVLHRQLTPSDIPSGNHEFSKSQYNVQDKDSVVDRVQQIEMAQMEAAGLFYSMIKSNKKDLVIIMDYLGMSVSENADTPAITSIFNRYIKDPKDSVQNTRLFIKTAEKLASEDGETELYVFSKLKALAAEGRIKQKKGEIWYNDEQLGKTFKDAASNVLRDKDQLKQLLAL